MTKKLPLILCLCLVLASAMPVSAQNIQLLANNGFEFWSNGPNIAPDNWINIIADTITATRESSTIHGGSYSTRLTWISPTQANCDFLSDPVPVIEGQAYACTTWAYDNDAGGRITLSFRWNVSNFYPGTYTIDSPSWQRITCNQVAPVGATSLRVGIRCYDVSSSWDGSSTVFVDDINLWGPEVQGNQPPSISSVLRYPYPTITPSDNAIVTATIVDTDGILVSDSLYSRVVPNAFAPVTHDSVALGHAHWFTIGQHDAGDSVEYFVAATDDEGARAISPTRGYTVIGGAPVYATIYSLQHTSNSGSLPDCFPTDSVGTYTITGKVVGRYENPTGTYHQRFFLQEAGSAWNGIYVYLSPDTVQVGDSLTITGSNAEYYSETELSNITSQIKHSSGRPLPAPIVVPAANFGPDSCNASAEPYEGMLIQINNLTVVDTAGNGDFYAVNNTDTVVIMNDIYAAGGDEPIFTIGQEYSYIRGIGRYSFGMYRIGPRFSADVLPRSLVCTGGNIFSVENSLDPGTDSTDCWPSPDSGQMVVVCGIVTAVTQGNTPRFYLQDQTNSAWGGIYSYGFRVNNSTDTIHVAVGDYVQLTAHVKEYFGWTEFDSVSAFNLLGSSQPLPDTTFLSVSTFAAMCDYTAESFENVLVRLNNVTVTSDNGFGELWIRDNSGPDSIRIDSDLWEFGIDQPNPIPSVGAVYNYVVGVVRWEGRQSSSYDRGWILLPRFASDYDQAVIPEPNIDKVWPINSTSMAVTFDRVMDPITAGNPANYSTLHGLSITGAVRDNTNHKKVLLTTVAQPNNSIDSLVVVNVCDSTGICMTTPHQKLYHSGFTSLAIVNTPGADGDTSDYKGDLITIKAVVVADTSMTFPNNLFVNDQSGPPYNGVLIFLPAPYTPFPVFADTVIATARIDEYFKATELTDLNVYNNVVIAGHGAQPGPFEITAATLNADKEAYEGLLVTLCDSFEVTNATFDPYGFTIRSLSTPNDSLIIHKQLSHTRYAYSPTVGDHIRGITGVFRYQRDQFRLMPRYDADFNSYNTWCGGGPIGCQYVVGDVNNNGAFNGIDVTYGVSYFKGGNPPPYSCECGSSIWYVTGDVNASCVFNGIDITYMVSYFKGGPSPNPCAACPPSAAISAGEIIPSITPRLKAHPVNIDGSR